ncbi:MAG: hypothetical protein QY323_01680 [Patescibacteria group bacterium]|nr:MAG: hypothetical protein QY323_01680 [Patescibacteria group bacterium]
MNKHYFRILLVVGAASLIVVAYAAFVRQPDGAVVTPETPVQTPVEQPSAPTESATAVLAVKWSAPKEMTSPDLFSEAYKEMIERQRMTDFPPQDKLHRVGTVVSEPYAGAMVVIVTVTAMNMGDYTTYHALLPKSGKPVLLANHSPFIDSEPNEYGPVRFDAEKFVIDDTNVIPELIFPTTIEQNGATMRIQRLSLFGQQDPQKDAPLFDSRDRKIAFVHETLGTMYTDTEAVARPQHGFYAVAPDGTVRAYALDVPFYDEDVHVPDVTWADGLKNTEEYWATDVGGCGASNFLSVVQGVAQGDLVAVGKTSQGESVYALKNADHALLKDTYENSYAMGRGDDKMSYEDFVKAQPLFFWRDPFGRLAKFQKAAFLPAVECGKPVIYLYPEETTDVSVKLYPQGGFTVTEPAYDGGWNVRATPKGELTNLKDGKAYPYLFWEGRGGLYETPKQGFVVAQKDVHAFLVEKLSALGLNTQERADFIEFWEPRMSGSPWYFVTFMGNRTMDALAPLEISPKPDTVIRVLMDFLPLEKPIPVQGFDIQTPVRDGFTVVEWGGVIR